MYTITISSDVGKMGRVAWTYYVNGERAGTTAGDVRKAAPGPSSSVVAACCSYLKLNTDEAVTLSARPLGWIASVRRPSGADAELCP